MRSVITYFKSFFKINATPGKAEKLILPWVLFVVFIGWYVIVSNARTAENPEQKLTPTIHKMFDGFIKSIYDPTTSFEGEIKPFEEKFRLLSDTLSSMRRFLISLAIIFIGVIIGLTMGMIPRLNLLLSNFFLFFLDKVHAMSLIGVMILLFGLDETSKIILIVIGVIPTVVLDTYQRAKEYPRELVTKAMTLGFSQPEIIFRVTLRNIFPNVLNNIRLNFKAIWGYIIVSETLAASAGLGFRIFLVKRYQSMDIIIPYILWIGFLAFITDWLVQARIERRYKWLNNN